MFRSTVLILIICCGIPSVATQRKSAPTRITVTAASGASGPVDANFSHVLKLTGNYTSAQFTAMVNALPAGSVLVRPADGQSAIINLGSGIDLPREQMTLYKVSLTGSLGIPNRTTLWSVHASPFVFNSSGDNVVLRDSYFSGGAGTALKDGCKGNIYHQNTLSNAENWVVENNTFENYTNREGFCADDHSEALYLGESTKNWMIRGNRFNNNGSTGHIFFTWWYCGGSYKPSCDHVNICLKDNQFTNVVNIYGTSIQYRAEFPNSMSIYIDPGQSNLGGAFPSQWIRPCPSI